MSAFFERSASSRSSVDITFEALLVPIVFALSSLVQGETCPAPEDVVLRVRAILHLGTEQELSEAFIVERREVGLFVELRAADGSVIGERTLPKDGSCDELAQAAAVVLGAWLNDAHPDFAGALPPSEPPTPEPVAPVVSEPPVPVPEKPRPAPAPQPRRSPTPPHHWEIGLGVGADRADSALAVAGSLRVALMPPRNGLGLGLTALVDASREQRLGAGTFSWRRWPLALSPTFRVAGRGWDVDASAGPALAWLHLAGSGFEPDKRSDGASWAGFADLRVASRATIGLWAGLSGLVYFEKSTAFVGAARQDLPRLALAAWLGARWAP